MIKALINIFFGIIICSCSSTKIENNQIKYFDENNVEISESKFNQKRATNKLLDISGDSIHHKKLVLREKTGKINNRSILESLLEEEIGEKIDSNKPMVIIYYPGKDPCNSSATKNKERIMNKYNQLEIQLQQIAQVKPIYIYKDDEGLKKYEGIIEWKKDPERMIEKLFFKFHYPCQSFVVISKDGDYISYFGEFPIEYVWEATRILNK